jgi:DNA-3-methyladenine glycosylase I
VDELGSFATYVWSFEPDGDARPKRLDWTTLKEVTTSEEATAMSKDLKRRGWSFVGPTTVYSMMESIGLVNDHLSDCALRDEVERARASFLRPVAGGRSR